MRREAVICLIYTAIAFQVRRHPVGLALKAIVPIVLSERDPLHVTSLYLLICSVYIAQCV